MRLALTVSPQRTPAILACLKTLRKLRNLPVSSAGVAEVGVGPRQPLQSQETGKLPRRKRRRIPLLLTKAEAVVVKEIDVAVLASITSMNKAESLSFK